jgi:hypothetical protein
MAMASDDSDTQMKWAFPLFLKTQKGGGVTAAGALSPTSLLFYFYLSK